MSEVKEKTHSFPIPEGYNKRYTLDLLIKRKSVLSATSIADILQQLLQALEKAGPEVSLKKRMLYEYRSQKAGQEGPPLSDGRLKVIAKYFGVTVQELYTE